ncbi:MAG: tRNA pseudouridine(13) synthase TruD [Gemmataceae bacterium]|nr:tRNA pseudouridine(13) synthase TruD [Gemmataceae bacterium]
MVDRSEPGGGCLCGGVGSRTPRAYKNKIPPDSPGCLTLKTQAMAAAAPLVPLLTKDLPGTGGRIKVQPEDFEVDEIPAYEPCGRGDFLYLWIEKRDLGAELLPRLLAQRLGIAPSEVGAAGLKDRRAVTRQWVSVPAHAAALLARLDGDGLRLLHATRHTHKLRPGHLRGNRFRILIRDVDASAAARAAAILERLRAWGLPNFYGEQRFGRAGETLALGLRLLRGQTPDRKVRNPFLKKLALSAVQSALFNHYLAQRLADGLFRRVLRGDVAAKYPRGGLFVVQDPGTEQARFDARELVTAGPIFGRKTFPAHADAAEREAQTLAAFELTPQAFTAFGKLVQGTRRHNLVYVDDAALQTEADGLRLTFTLPAGSYATVFLRELMKSDRADPDAERSAAAVALDQAP